MEIGRCSIGGVLFEKPGVELRGRSERGGEEGRPFAVVPRCQQMFIGMILRYVYSGTLHILLA